jgi:7,8-dihydropterin-6-yl-methyl-4-(beta-D-ribofuranosyl)aminobenzene 5'-phosphate synthase
MNSRMPMERNEGTFPRGARMGEDVRITVLSENTSPRADLDAEFGLSLWIEADGKKILFDTGQGRAFESNAEKLGIDLSETVHLVLSHGHYDHTGGILQALGHAPGALVHLHPDAALPKYFVLEGMPPRYIGMPEPSIEALRHGTSRCLFHTGPTRLAGNVFLTGPVPRKTPFERIVEPFTLNPEGSAPDTVEDDQALWIETDAGLVVVLGCAHSGVVNTVEYIMEKSGRREIRALIGGMHLVNSDRESIGKTVDAVASWNPGLVAPNHCTGDAARALFRERLQDVFTEGSTGSFFSFPLR